MEIRYFDTLESTNSYCKLLDMDHIEEFTVICALNQTAGVGQRGNIWVSEPYKNLTFSIILKPHFVSADNQYSLTMAVAVAIATTLEGMLPGSGISIKWPNDIYVGDSKICGFLTSCQLSGTHLDNAVCGIGLNVNQTAFPDWVPNPTSMKMIAGSDFDIRSTLNILTDNLQDAYSTLHSTPAVIKREYLQRLYRLGVPSRFRVAGEEIQATITGVNKYGHLLLDTPDGPLPPFDIKQVQFVI